MDALISLLAQIAPHHWLALALVLLIAEMATGTTYLLWPAVAAGITGLVAFLPSVDWPVEMALFAVLVIGLTLFGRPLVRRLRSADAPALNERATQMIGARGVVAHFADGVGSVKIADSVWRAVSDDALEPGQNVEIAGIDGTTLKVRRLA